MVPDPDYGSQLELRRHQGGISPSTPPRPKPQVQSVPPILRRQRQNSMPGYSKGAQGLSVYVRVTGIFTGTTDSPSALRRQCPNRYAIRAGRNLPDKEFRLIVLLPPTWYVEAGRHFCRPLHVAMQSGLYLRADLGKIRSPGVKSLRIPLPFGRGLSC
jgi:hypothetical protein